MSDVVLVTGGSRGLGLALVEDLIEHGYRIATCSRNASPDVERLTRAHTDAGKFFWSKCAVGDEQAEQSWFQEVVEWAGEDKVYGLINNAAITGEGILATFPNVDTARILEVNLLASLRLARLALQEMLRCSRGRIINISSIVGSRGYTGLSAYAASKAGMDGFTRALAREVGRRQITVNSVAPGYMETALSAALGERQKKQIVARTPLGRLGTPADLVPVVRFLLSDDARFLTGQTVVVDGGISN